MLEQPEEEVARLEALLAERAKVCRELAAESGRRAALVREVITRLPDRPAAPIAAAPDPMWLAQLEEARAERDAAVSRALDAEAGRAVALLRLDEALGHLQQRPAPTPSERDAERAAQAAARELCALAGERNGIAARLSETEAALESLLSRVSLAERSAVEAHERRDSLHAELAAATLGGQRRAAGLHALVLEVREALATMAPGLRELAAGAGEGWAARDSEVTPEVTPEPTMPGVEVPPALRDAELASLRGELIDLRSNNTRLSDELARARSRRRRLAVAVRALEAAQDAGEDTRPWVSELVTVLNESMSPPAG